MSTVRDSEHDSYYDVTKFSLDPLNRLYEKTDIIPFIDKLFLLNGRKLKGVKRVNSLEATKLDLSWVTNDTCGWVDFYLYYKSWLTIKPDMDKWREENDDVGELCDTMKYLLVNIEAFSEKDGYFYILENISLIKEINLEWTFST